MLNRTIEMELFAVRKYLEHALFGVILLGIVALALYPYLRARKAAAPVTSSTITDAKRYSTDMKELQNKFNQDKGKVRLLLLLSPT